MNPPKPTKGAWFKIISRYTIQCPHCGTELLRRFAEFDAGLAGVLTMGGAVSVWGAGKFVLPLAALVIAGRLVAGRILAVYVLAKK